MSRYFFLSIFFPISTIFFSYSQVKQDPKINDQKFDSVNVSKYTLFLHLGINGSIFSVRDQSTSPLIYRGFLPGLNIGTDYFSQKLRIHMNYEFSYGFLKTRNYPLNDDNTPDAYNNLFGINVLFCINPRVNNGFNIFGGMGSSVTANFRTNQKYDNASFNYEFIAGIGPAFHIEKTWIPAKDYVSSGFFSSLLKKRTIKLSATIYTPLIGAALRPSYNTVKDYATDNSQIKIEKTAFASLDKLLAFIGDLHFYYFLQNNNAFRITYSWRFYNYHPEYNHVNSVSGVASFAILFRLNNK
jgi:hypothetical protein